MEVTNIDQPGADFEQNDPVKMYLDTETAGWAYVEMTVIVVTPNKVNGEFRYKLRIAEDKGRFKTGEQYKVADCEYFAQSLISRRSQGY